MRSVSGEYHHRGEFLEMSSAVVSPCAMETRGDQPIMHVYLSVLIRAHENVCRNEIYLLVLSMLCHEHRHLFAIAVYFLGKRYRSAIDRSRQVSRAMAVVFIHATKSIIWKMSIVAREMHHRHRPAERWRSVKYLEVRHSRKI